MCPECFSFLHVTAPLPPWRMGVAGERLEGVEGEVGLELDRTDEQRIGDQGLGTGSPVTRDFSL